jgi:competence protein ComEC
VSAFLILIIWPESLVHPSFLMSFLAVISIIITYDNIYKKKLLAESNNIIRYIFFMLITSLVATIATLPIILINFNNMALYSIISNLIAVPLTNTYLMPCVILYFLAYPLGMSNDIAALMKPGLKIFQRVAESVSSLPYANLKVSFIDHSLVYTLVFCVILSLFVHSSVLKKISLTFGIILAFYIPFSIKTADFILNKDLQLAMFRNKQDIMEFSKNKVPNWYKNAYLSYAGMSDIEYNPDFRISEFCCDNGFCAYTKNNMRIIIDVENAFKNRLSPNGCDNFQDHYQINQIINLNEVEGGFYASMEDDVINITTFLDISENRIWHK